MHLPVMPPVAPMLARPAAEIPAGLRYEPKWDGFRCIVFRDADDLELGSRNEKPLTRYFPELARALLDSLPPRCVIDGEIVIAREGVLDFEALLQRIHPAASRVALLAADTPASFVAFDLLAEGDESLLAVPFSQRRARLEGLLAGSRPPVHLTPCTDDQTLATHWFHLFEGAGLDGVIAKPPDLSYQPGKRVMTKIKHARTADCVVAGFRWHASGPVVGSLLLGLHDDAGTLQHVGVCGAFSMSRRQQLVDELEPLRAVPADSHPWAESQADQRTPEGAAPSRWNRGKDLSFVALRPELVVEVGYDHMEGSRFRHTTQFVRWRPDRDPASCGYDQLDRPVRFDLASVLAGHVAPAGGTALGNGPWETGRDL